MVDENNETSTESIAEKPAPVKKSSKNIQTRNAQDFYAVAKQFMTSPIDKTPLQTLQKDATDALSFFMAENILPPVDFTFDIAKLPQYFAYTQSY